jgi:hypothetical protein
VTNPLDLQKIMGMFSESIPKKHALMNIRFG